MGRKFTILLCFTLYSRSNSKYKPLGGLIFVVGGFNAGFFVLQFWGGLIHGGAYFWNCTVRNIIVVV